MKKFGIEFWSWTVSIAATIMIIGLLAFGLSAIERFSQVNESWRAYNENATATNQTLAKLRGSVGYGGFIHNFKNYVLRRNAIYRARVEKDIGYIESLLKQYHKVLSSESERNALRSIEVVFTNYFDMFLLVSAMIAEGKSSAEIDAAVKINDKPALEAFDNLIDLAAAQSRSMEALTDADLHSAIRFSSIGTLLVFLVAGIAVLVIWFVRKITRVNAQLQTANNRVNLLFDTAPDAMICVRPDGEIVRSNVQAGLLFGYTKFEFNGMSIENLLPEAFRAKHKQLRAGFFQSPTHRPIGMGPDLVALTKDGRQPSVEISLSHSSADEDPLATITVRNITERKNLEQQLRQAQKMEVVGQLTGGVAHDFNNLMGVIIGNTEILEGRIGEDETAQRNIEAIFKAINRGSSLTNRLLAFSRLQPLSPKPIPINVLVLGLEDMIQRTLGETIALSTRLEPGNCVALIDQHQCEDALINLSINARDAMPDGGKLIIETSNTVLDDTYTQKFEELTPGDYVKIAVSDTGTGMSPEVLENAFEPFFTTKNVGEGSGLGLSMAYGFAKQSNGHITIDSVEGQGTTINLYLPRAKEAVVED